jgi:pimeloyl-ACP methyl ester carboxylesterase
MSLRPPNTTEPPRSGAEVDRSNRQTFRLGLVFIGLSALAATNNYVNVAAGTPFPALQIGGMMLHLCRGFSAAVRTPWSWHILLGGLVAGFPLSFYYTYAYINQFGSPPLWALASRLALSTTDVLWFAYFYRRRAMFGSPLRWPWIEQWIPMIAGPDQDVAQEKMPQSSVGIRPLSRRMAIRLGIVAFMLLLLLYAWTATRLEREGELKKGRSLTEARSGFRTNLIRRVAAKRPVPAPPHDLFQAVRYDSQVGKLAAYLSHAPTESNRHPAIIWIFGGMDNSIGETAWKEAPPGNDQSASAFRKAGIVMMYPSFRGGNDNPGVYEAFYGEVDDVLAAADFLALRESVDPERMYLGGHSTGGTLALLVAASTDRFRAVFSFGPVDDVGGYGAERLPFRIDDERERELRSPKHWLDSIRSAVFVFEGTREPSNRTALRALSSASRNHHIRFHVVEETNHFSILGPLTRLIADKILRDSGRATNVAFADDELNRLIAR